METPKYYCLSTHGSSGYAPGSYWKDGAIICGICGARIENPPPTGGYKDAPAWPEWIPGAPPKMAPAGLHEARSVTRRFREFIHSFAHRPDGRED